MYLQNGLRARSYYAHHGCGCGCRAGTAGEGRGKLCKDVYRKYHGDRHIEECGEVRERRVVDEDADAVCTVPVDDEVVLSVHHGVVGHDRREEEDYEIPIRTQPPAFYDQYDGTIDVMHRAAVPPLPPLCVVRPRQHEPVHDRAVPHKQVGQQDHGNTANDERDGCASYARIITLDRWHRVHCVVAHTLSARVCAQQITSTSIKLSADHAAEEAGGATNFAVRGACLATTDIAFIHSV